MIRAIFHAMTGKSGKLEDYLLDFCPQKEESTDNKIDSQAVWLGMFGIDRDDPSTWGNPE